MERIELTIVQTPGTVTGNFDEIKEQLASELEFYKSLVFTEDNKKAAKEDVAILRKAKASAADYLKDIRHKCLEPYDAAKAKIDELCAMIDEPIYLINKQLDAFEQNRLEERRNLIRQIWDDEASIAPERLTLERIYNRKWENAGTSRNSIRKEMQERIAAINQELAIINGTASAAVPRALEMYWADFNLMQATQYINQYEQQKREIERAEEERRRQYEERRRMEEERRRKEEQDRLAREQERIHAEELERVRQEERERIKEEHEMAASAIREEGETINPGDPFETETGFDVQTAEETPFQVQQDEPVYVYRLTISDNALADQFEETMRQIGIPYDKEVV